MSEEGKDYYVKRKRVILRQFDAASVIAKNSILEIFGEKKYNEIHINAREKLEDLLPQVPYIGGKENHLTESLVNSVILLPLLLEFEKQGLSFKDIGTLTYNIFEAFYKVIPMPDDLFSNEYINKAKEDAIKSKERDYPGNWVFDYIEGDGKIFTFGIDYQECGVHKFYTRQGAERFLPIVCIADFAQAQINGYGLYRTQTIGNGASICDFRYLKDGSTPRAWPPDNLPEFKAEL